MLREHEGDHAAAVQALRAIADELRLPVPPAVEPLPEIELDDVRLIVWVAVHGEAQQTAPSCSEVLARRCGGRAGRSLPTVDSGPGPGVWSATVQR